MVDREKLAGLMVECLPISLEDTERASILSTIDAILAEIEAQGYCIVRGWQPIETAPEDDRLIMVIGGRRFSRADIVPSDGEWWRMEKGSKAIPTHWMPLPPAPAMIEAEKEG